MQPGLKSRSIRRALRLAATGLAALALGACATLEEQQAAAPGDEAEGLEGDFRIVNIEPVRPKIPLTEEILYKLLLAELAGHRGKLDVAVENYRDLAYATRDPKVAERAARIAVYARDNAAALEAARLWVELDPRNPDPRQVLAVMELRAGNLERTVAHLQDIFDYSEGEVDQKLWMIANMLSREEERDAALAVMETLVESQGDSAEAQYAFAHIAARLGDLERSLTLLKSVLARTPDNDNAGLSYVSVLQRMGREREALAWLKDSLEGRAAGDDFALRMAYARLLADVKRFDEAQRQFELLAAQEPDNAEVSYTLGLLHLQSDRLDQAETFFQRLSKQGWRTDVVNYYLGRIAEGQEEYETASAWYQGVHKGEHYFDAQVRLALLLARAGQVEEARVQLRAIPTQGEQQALVVTQAEGELLVGEKRYAEAIAVYDQALEGGYNANLLYARAMAAERGGQLDILEADLRAILEREPNHAQALNALGYTLADATERYAEAYELIKRALALSPSDFYILDSMGWVLYRLGRLDEAIDYLRRALSLRADPEIAAHLGEALWVNGDREEAKKVWESALKLRPDDSRLLDVIQRFNP